MVLNNEHTYYFATLMKTLRDFGGLSTRGTIQCVVTFIINALLFLGLIHKFGLKTERISFITLWLPVDFFFKCDGLHSDLSFPPPTPCRGLWKQVLRTSVDDPACSIAALNNVFQENGMGFSDFLRRLS